MGVAVEAIREQIDRLIRSKTFEASDVHRRLLQYLAEKSIAGDADRLKEYTVGLEAFGKPPTYDPKQDSIVRLQVGRLRQKLAVYYQGEANGDPVRVTLPKGAFKLQFELIESTHSGTAARYAQPQFPMDGRRTGGRSRVGRGCQHLRYSHAPGAAPIADSWSPELEALWGPFLESKRSMLICLGTPLFVRFPGFGFFRDPKANDWQESSEVRTRPGHAQGTRGRGTAALLRIHRSR